MSQVSVLVMLCTAMGASPPTGTLPTQILRVGRRLMGDSECMDYCPSLRRAVWPRVMAERLTASPLKFTCAPGRSEERRVGKEWRSRRARYHLTNNDTRERRGC